MKFTLLLVLLVSTASTASSRYELVVDYERSKATKHYLHGSLYAFMTANGSLRADQQAPLFCLPSNLPLNSGNAVDIFEAELKLFLEKWDINHPIWANTTLSHVLLLGLQRTFPL